MAIQQVNQVTWHTHSSGKALKYSVFYDDDWVSPKPVIIHVSIWNNGGFADGNIWDYEQLINAGYCVMNCSFRGAVSESAPWPAQILDVKAFIRWLKIQTASPFDLIDMTKISIMGGSAGAVVAGGVAYSHGMPEDDSEYGVFSIGATRTDSKVQAFINIYGSLNISTYDRPVTEDQNDFILDLLGKNEWSEVTDSDMRTIDITKFRSSHLPPCFTGHASDDNTNPVIQAQLWSQHCVNLSIDHTLKIYVPDSGETIGHSITNLLSAGLYTDLINFLNDIFL